MNYLKTILYSIFCPWRIERELNEQLDGACILYHDTLNKLDEVIEANKKFAVNEKYLLLQRRLTESENTEEDDSEEDLGLFEFTEETVEEYKKRLARSEADNRIDDFIDAQTAEHLIKESANEWSKRK